MEKAWYKTWFDSPYYHLLYENRNEDEARQFLLLLLEKLQLEPGSLILDAPCGTGRHTRYLSSKGYIVTGVDLSEFSIDQAKKKNEFGAEFMVHDIRRIFRVNYFDLVLNLFTSLGYAEKKDDQKILHSFHQSLKHGGRLVLDFMNIETTHNNLCPYEEFDKKGVHFRITRSYEGGRFHKEIRISKGKEIQLFRESVLAWSKKELEVLLEETGFTIQSVYGNYSLSTFDPGNSPRLIFIAEKKS